MSAELRVVNWGPPASGGEADFLFNDIKLGDKLALSFGLDTARRLFQGEITGARGARRRRRRRKLAPLADDTLHRMGAQAAHPGAGTAEPRRHRAIHRGRCGTERGHAPVERTGQPGISPTKAISRLVRRWPRTMMAVAGPRGQGSRLICRLGRSAAGAGRTVQQRRTRWRRRAAARRSGTPAGHRARERLGPFGRFRNQRPGDAADQSRRRAPRQRRSSAGSGPAGRGDLPPTHFLLPPPDRPNSFAAAAFDDRGLALPRR